MRDQDDLAVVVELQGPWDILLGHGLVAFREEGVGACPGGVSWRYAVEEGVVR
jgi:hypothetical protein